MKYAMLPVFLIGISLTGQMNIEQISPQAEKKPVKTTSTSVPHELPQIPIVRR
jgi:hypothetical protein